MQGFSLSVRTRVAADEAVQNARALLQAYTRTWILGGNSTDERPDQARARRHLGRRTGSQRLWLELTERRGGASTAPSVSVSAERRPQQQAAREHQERRHDQDRHRRQLRAEPVPGRRRQDRQGMDVDLFNAVAHEVRRQDRVAARPTSPASSPASQGKKYDMGISSFTINDERMKQVNMVSYFYAGTQWATRRRATRRASTPTMPCGKNIAVQNSTVQETRRPAGAAEEVRQQPDQRPVRQGPGARPPPPWSPARPTPCWPTPRSSRTR